ncbi:MAG: hypothetical protein PHT58_06615 [Eubacteriales bacterium]|nr:hypothetical protein [Eubacteriales bacterium]
MKKICLLLAALLLFACTSTFADINDKCSIEIHAASVNMSSLTDYTFSTAIDMTDGDGFTVTWTDAVPLECIYWEWLSIPQSYQLTLKNEKGDTLATESRSNDIRFGCVYPSDGVYGIELRVVGQCQLTELFAYKDGEVPKKAIVWEDPVDKADILIVRAHGNDDMWMLGGIVPTYAGERGYSVQILDLACDTIGRQRKSLPGTYLNGMTHYPVFLGFVGLHTYSYSSILEAWEADERDPVEQVVEQIRRFRPEVIVTHSIDGDYDGTHKLVAEIVNEAYVAAADPAQYTASAQEYGVWQVKKVYFHLYQDNPITLDFDVPLSAFDGKTAFEMAQLGYQCWDPNAASSGLRSIRNREYDMSKYGLAFSTVGADIECNDLLENLPLECLSDFVPTPSPEPTFTPEPTSEPTIIPTSEPVQTAAPANEPVQQNEISEPTQGNNTQTYLWIGCGVAVILTVVGSFVFGRNRSHKKER